MLTYHAQRKSILLSAQQAEMERHKAKYHADLRDFEAQYSEERAKLTSAPLSKLADAIRSSVAALAGDR